MLIFISLLLGLCNGEPLSSKDNAYCQPRKTVVAVDPDRHSYFPYYVEVFRCLGSCASVSPNIKTCVHTAYQNITISAYDFQTGEIKDLYQRNDTKCGCSCTLNRTACNNATELWSEKLCRCTCRYEEPPVPCKPGFEWDTTQCSCTCALQPKFCPRKQIWSPKRCDCYCLDSTVSRCRRKGKILDEQTCKCLKEAVSGRRDYVDDSHSMYITAAVVEFIFLFIMFDFCLYHKNTGVVFTLKGLLQKKMKNFQTEDRETEKSDNENSELVFKITST